MSDTPAGLITLINCIFDRTRTDKGLNEGQLADFLAVDQSTVNRWRKGRALGKTALIIPLAAQYGKECLPAPAPIIPNTE